MIVGCGGAGKSTLARALGERLDVPVVHLDRIFWKPGWVKRPMDEFLERQRAELSKHAAWVCDGNYGRTMDYRLGQADTVVFVDRSRWLCLWRVIRRRLRQRERPDMAAGCREQINLEFLRYVWSYNTTRRATILKRLESARLKGLRVYRLRTERDVRQFVEDC